MIETIPSVNAKKINAARKEVHIFWFLTPPSKSRDNINLWPKLHGEAYCHEPTADILLNVLIEEEIFTNVTIEEQKKNPDLLNTAGRLPGLLRLHALQN